METVEKKKLWHPAFGVFIACFLMFGVHGGIIAGCYGNMLKPMAAGLGVEYSQVSLYGTIYNYTMVIGLFVVGYLYKKFDAKILCIIGLCIETIAYSCISFVTTLPLFYVLAVLVACGASLIIYTPVPLLMSRWFKKNFGLFFGITIAGSGVVTTIVSPIVGGWVKAGGWQCGWRNAGILGFILSVPIVILLLKSSPEKAGCKAFGETDEAPDNAVKTPAAAAPAEKLGIGKILGSGVFWLLVVFCGLESISCYTQPHISSYAQTVGLDAVAAGACVSTIAVGSIFGKILLGWLKDRIGPVIATVIAMVVGAIAILLIRFGASNYTALYAGCVLFGMSLYSANTALTPLIGRDAISKDNFAQTWSYVSALNKLISANAVWLYGKIFTATGSFDAVFTTAFICVVVSCVAGLFAIKVGRKGQTA